MSSDNKCCFKTTYDLDASTLRVCRSNTTCCNEEEKLQFHHACVAKFNSAYELDEQAELCPFCSDIDNEMVMQCVLSQYIDDIAVLEEAKQEEPSVEVLGADLNLIKKYEAWYDLFQ